MLFCLVDGKRFTLIRRAAKRLKQPPSFNPLKKGLNKLCTLAYRLRPFASDDPSQVLNRADKNKGGEVKLENGGKRGRQRNALH
jgi:hypothetical protein